MDDKWKWSIVGLAALLLAVIAVAVVSENQAKGACAASGGNVTTGYASAWQCIH